jgi:hypothetical protein
MSRASSREQFLERRFALQRRHDRMIHDYQCPRMIQWLYRSFVFLGSLTMDANLLPNGDGGRKMEYLIPAGILLIWIILQAWVLPRMGVQT